jgi:hypothetical protein
MQAPEGQDGSFGGQASRSKTDNPPAILIGCSETGLLFNLLSDGIVFTGKRTRD